jgi:hypothetical protein
MKYGLDSQNNKILAEFTDLRSSTLIGEIIKLCNTDGKTNPFKLYEHFVTEFDETSKKIEAFLNPDVIQKNNQPICVLEDAHENTFLIVLGNDNIKLELIHFDPAKSDIRGSLRESVRFCSLKDHGVLLSVLNELVRRVTKNNNGQTIFTENLIRVIQELSTERHVRNYLY